MRIISFNITYTHIYMKKIINILRFYKADIIALQNVNNKQYFEIQNNLNKCYRILKSSSNVLLSKFYISDFKIINLNLNDTALWAKMIIENEDYNIMITCLNNTSETIRLTQIEILKPWLNITHILIGNLNSLFRDDFINSKDYRFDVMDNLKAMGFIMNKFSGHTIDNGMRVDYILYKKDDKFLNSDNYTFHNFVLDAITTRISNHNPVVLDVLPLIQNISFYNFEENNNVLPS